MKNKISFLAIAVFAFGTNCVIASECIGTDCELTPMVITEQETVDVLTPVKYDIDWMDQTETAQSCQYDYRYDYNCPFATESECETWHKKPIYKTNLFPRAPHINSLQMDDMLYAIYENYDVNANNPKMYPLLARYKILTNASRACCNAGIIYKMRENGANDKAVYQFLKDDANYYAVMSRCMMMNDNEIMHNYSNGVTGQMVADVRNACLCKNRQWFESLLQPFFDVYERAPQFEESHFVYSYIDGMQRDITVYINDEVKTTSGLLGACPK